MTDIKIIDSIMGSGKTSWAIQYMNEAPIAEKFIYITPFLTEVARVKASVTDRNFLEPNNANADRRKLSSLKDLIVQDADIVSTHSLFQTADEELVELLTESGYTLILDEVMDVIEPVNVNASDIRKLETSGDIIVDGNKVIWKGDPRDDSRYRDIRLLAQAGNLFYHRGKFLVWSFPPKVFRAFDKAFMLTYLFDGQLQRYYYDMFQFQYSYNAVRLDGEQYELTDYDPHAENRGEVFKLIDLYDGKLNDVGKRSNALSSTYLRNADVDVLRQIKNNLYNYFQNIAGVKMDQVYWSTLKELERPLAPKGYRGRSIPVNSRATNEYKAVEAIAYVFNRYPNPHERAFFEDNGVTVNVEALAASDLLQWVWRSRIREGQPIKLYLPSSRMRGLLKAWANYEI
ncbi:hypothetical protein LC085_07650 [Bacillus tianshenii]|uniref:hypothetical protein n=1 Tax=Sutcliffiella tianshenii TaxID=1463404 RepID=UPI001CD39320|nr:hypothetical protein [Bacillus tianshenii]MCA1319786.1 hypothetical protein [Bacillus tianshenii]